MSPRVGPTGESVAGWADAGVIIPWAAYLQFRDTRILEDNWAAMEKWMEHIAGANPNYLWLKERGNDYGDWLAIGSTTSKDLIATAYWAYDASLMMRMAQALDRPQDEQKYREVFEKVRTAFNQEYVKPDGTVGTGSQTSYVLALHMNLLSQKNQAIAAEKLVEDIKAHDWHLTTGFLGTPYLMIELSNSGHSDVAYRLAAAEHVSLLGIHDRAWRHHHVGALERRPDDGRSLDEFLQSLCLRSGRRMAVPLRRRHRRIGRRSGLPSHPCCIRNSMPRWERPRRRTIRRTDRSPRTGRLTATRSSGT